MGALFEILILGVPGLVGLWVLYWVIRLAVRHGVEDAWRRRGENDRVSGYWDPARSGPRASEENYVELPAGRMDAMRVVVLSDTHAPRRWRVCPPRVAEHLRGADLILHAGDVCTAAVLDELAQYAPVVAVVGNNDGPDVAAWGAADTAELSVGGLSVAMVHDSGTAAGRLARMRRKFPEADLVVFGHSHIPLDESGYGLRIFNPGSPTDRRRQAAGTLGVLHIEDGQITTATILPVT
jgi:uncharacterized protein